MALNWANLRWEYGEDGVLLGRIARVFLAELPQWRAQLKEDISERQPVQLERTAHTLKGALLHFGETQAARLAQRLEELGRELSLRGAEEICAQLDVALDELAKELIELREPPQIRIDRA